MSRRVAAALVAASALLFPTASPATAARPEPTTLVNSLNASVDTTFTTRQVAYFPIWAEQNLGPRFTLAEPTLLAHVGTFADARPDNFSGDAPPFWVEIRRADANGAPANGEPLAVASLSDDGDINTWRYESAQFRLRLQPGRYFALVSADAPTDLSSSNPDPGGVLVLAVDDNGALLWKPNSLALGYRNRLTGESGVTTDGGPFRVLGCVQSATPAGTTPRGRACNARSLL